MQSLCPSYSVAAKAFSKSFPGLGRKIIIIQLQALNREIFLRNYFPVISELNTEIDSFFCQQRSIYILHHI